MANNRKHNHKSLNVLKIVISLLKETTTFLYAIFVGILDMFSIIFE